MIRQTAGIEVTLKGHPPPPPFMMVSNHLGYTDIIVLASVMDARFIAKSEVAHWPLLGPLVRALDTIFVNRSNHRDLLRVNTLVESAIEDGDSVIVFPEGTSSPGDAVLPFKPSLLDCAAKNGINTHFAVIHYETPDNQPPAHEAVCWWGDMTFPDHFWRLLQVKTIRATVTFGKEAIVHSDRKTLARMLQESVDNHFKPTMIQGIS